MIGYPLSPPFDMLGVILVLIALGVGIILLVGAILLELGLQWTIKQAFPKSSFAAILINVIIIICLLL